MNNTVISILKGIGRYLLGAIIVFGIFYLFFRDISHTHKIIGLIIIGTLGLPILFVWRFWKGGVASIIILAIAFVFLKSGISLSSNNSDNACIDEFRAKKIIQEYYEQRFAADGITWFSDQWDIEKVNDGLIKVTAYYNADYCQPVCKEVFEVYCNGTYLLTDSDFSTNPNTEN